MFTQETRKITIKFRTSFLKTVVQNHFFQSQENKRIDICIYTQIVGDFQVTVNNLRDGTPHQIIYQLNKHKFNYRVLNISPTRHVCKLCNKHKSNSYLLT